VLERYGVSFTIFDVYVKVTPYPGDGTTEFEAFIIHKRRKG